MVTASVPIDHTRLLWSIAGSSWAVVLQQGRGQDSLKSYGDGWCLLVLMSFGGSQSVAGEWGSNGSICKNMVGDSLSSGRMESTVPEDLEIRISSDYKELAYREQTVPFVRLFLSVYSASVFSLCCPKDSQMVVLSVTSAHRWDRERGERQLSSAGALTLLTPDSGPQLEKSQVVISLIFSGSQVISSRQSPQLVCIRSSIKSMKTVAGAEKGHPFDPRMHAAHTPGARPCVPRPWPCRKSEDHTPTFRLA